MWEAATVTRLLLGNFETDSSVPYKYQHQNNEDLHTTHWIEAKKYYLIFT